MIIAIEEKFESCSDHIGVAWVDMDRFDLTDPDQKTYHDMIMNAINNHESDDYKYGIEWEKKCGVDGKCMEQWDHLDVKLPALISDYVVVWLP